MRIYKATDRIKLDIGELTVFFSPLTYQQKQEVQALLLEGQKQNSPVKMNEGIIQALKFSLKSIKGLQNADDSDYHLSFEDGNMSDESLDVILNLSLSAKMMQVVGKLLNGVPEDFEIEGVSYSKN